MPNMSQTKVPIPEQDPKVRAHNFEEVTLGYTKEMAMEEATRCLNCKNMPCVSGCPVGVRIPEFIKKITEGEFEQAYEIIHSTNGLPAVCGRVCPQER
ncbi:MAG TPA: dihydropyrimidine dehydrogenase, partial [Ruminococcus sp.]|nr:dihydropyrimidine dehydrogenase [Ruminococcus sp.]